MFQRSRCGQEAQPFLGLAFRHRESSLFSVIASLSRISISSLKHGLNVSVGPSIEAKLDFSPARVAIRILLCHSNLAIWRANNREHYEDIPVEQSRKPSKDELSCSSFVEVSNATLGNTGRALDLEIGSVSVQALARKVAFDAMVGCRLAIQTIERGWCVHTPKLSWQRVRPARRSAPSWVRSPNMQRFRTSTFDKTTSAPSICIAVL